MRFIGKILAVVILGFFVMNSLGAVALAAGEIHSGVLPSTETTVNACKNIMREVTMMKKTDIDKIFSGGDGDGGGPGTGDVATGETGGGAEETSTGGEKYTQSQILGCGIKTGNIKFWMVPYYIKYVLEFVIGVTGLISVGGIIYGGFLYLFAGVSQEKDKGKEAIKNALIGLVLTLTAWAIVNIVIALVTA